MPDSKSGKRSNRERLNEAGLLHKEHTLSDADNKAIESFDDAEMNALMSIKKKLNFNRPLVFPAAGGDLLGKLSFF